MNRRWLKYASALLMSSSLIACSSGSDSGSGAVSAVVGLAPINKLYGSCNHVNLADPNQRHCREWHGSYFASFSLQVSCNGIGGVYSTAACPSLSRVGTCYLGKDTQMETRFIYYSNNWSVLSGEANCALKNTTSLGGNLASTWVAGP